MIWPTLAKTSLLALLSVATVAGCGVVAERRAADRALRAETKYPPSGTLITVDGLRIHADQRGRGPDVVLIHGASGNLRDFTFGFADQIVAAGFRVTAFDRPGHGHSDDMGEAGISPDSQARVLRAAAQTMGVNRPIVVGHSYGGAVAMAWAVQAPDSVAAVVSLAGATMPWPGELGLWYRVTGSQFGQRAILPLIAAFAPMSQADSAINRIFAPDPVPDGYSTHIGAGLSLRAKSLQVNTLQVLGLRPFITELSSRYPSLEVPVEIVHGDADTTVGIDIHARPMAALLPNAKLTVLPGIGHMPHHAKPSESLSAVIRAAQRGGKLR